MSLFRIESAFWRNSSTWLNLIVKMCDEVFSDVNADDGRNNFVVGILLPVLKEVILSPRADGFKLTMPGDLELYDAGIKMLQRVSNRKIILKIGEMTDLCDYMQTGSGGRVICINPMWACAAKHSLEVMDKSHESLLHLYGGLMKVFHEIGNCFTQEILSYLNELAYTQFPDSSFIVDATPVNVGTKRIGRTNRIQGDMGSCFEKYLTGKGCIFIGQTPIWDVCELTYVTSEYAVVGMKETCVLRSYKVDEEEAFQLLSNICTTKPLTVEAMQWKNITAVCTANSRSSALVISASGAIVSTGAEDISVSFGCGSHRGNDTCKNLSYAVDSRYVLGMVETDNSLWKDRKT